MRATLLHLPDAFVDQIHYLSESQERTISDVGIEVVRRGLAGMPARPSAGSLTAPPPSEAAA